jgi:hypothetical protein
MLDRWELGTGGVLDMGNFWCCRIDRCGGGVWCCRVEVDSPYVLVVEIEIETSIRNIRKKFWHYDGR